LETELALEFVDRELPIMPFPLQHTKSHQAAGNMVQLPRLTAMQAELVLAHPDDLLDVLDVIVATHKTIDLVFHTQVYKLKRDIQTRSRS
jgi:hypothetical protein